MNVAHRIRLSFFLALIGLTLGWSYTVRAQGMWTHWTNSNGVGGMALQGDNLWMRVSNALIRYNTADGSYRRFTLKDGAPQTWIAPFLADSSGAVWFRGDDRIYRFDGFRWESWTGSDSVRFWGANSSLLDSKGNVWIATGTGVAKYDGHRWKVWKRIRDENSEVLVLAEDLSGRIWAGASNGVYRLENETWKQFYRTDNMNGMENWIISLAFDLSNNLWAGTLVDVARFDGESWISWNLDPDFGNHHVQCLLRDKRGDIWAATLDGVSRFDGNTWTNWRAESEMATVVKYLFEDSKGHIWAASQTDAWGQGTKGVFCYDGESWKHWTMGNGLAGDWITGILEDRRGTVWIGTDKGLSGFRDSGWTTWHWMPDMESPGTVLSLFDDGAGRIWAGTRRGVSRFNGSRWEMLMDYPEGRVAAATSAAPLIKDSEGQIWVGLAYWEDQGFGIGGASRFEDPGWTMYTYRSGFDSGFVRAFLVDHNGRLWVGTDRGAARFENGKWAFQNSENDIYSVHTLFQDRHGNIWAGSAKGAHRFDGISWRTYTEADGLASGTVASFLEDSEGNLFDLTSGLFRFDGSRWTQMQGLPDSLVTCMLLDRAGKIWVGAASGVCRLDGDRWTTWKTGSDLGRGAVTSLAVDKDNVIWAGLRPERDAADNQTGGGIARFDGTTWRTWTDSEGLPSNTVTCITVDGANDVWAGMEGGVSRFSAKDTPVSEETAKPSALRISSIQPNPFNSSTVIRFELPEAGRVSLSIYDITGRKVRELISGYQPAGVHAVAWDGCDNAGRAASSGVYLSRVSMGRSVAMGRMALLK